MIIDQLPEITIANDSDEIAIEQGTATKKINKGNFLQEVVSSIQSLIASVSGKVSKAGDTMTGDLKIQKSKPVIRKDATNFDNQIGQGVPSAETIYAEDTIYDRDESLTGYSQIFKNQNDLLSRNFMLRRRNASGTAIINGFILRIDSSGNPVVSFPSTSVSAAWRTALGLTYAANDTFSNSYVIAGGYVTTGATEIWFTVQVPKSMENISTITVTSLNGLLRGINGYLNNNSTVMNYATSSEYTITTYKQSNTEVRIILKKSSAFTNATNNTPTMYAGNITLKFT